MPDRHVEIISTWARRESPDFGYFTRFEDPAKINIFWGPKSRFRVCFDYYLDLTDTLEIACGAGRHSAQIVRRCKSLTLLDTSPDALETVKRRFADSPNVMIILSEDGMTLPVRDESMSAVFSYDAMVHFEPLTIAAYFQATARVLRPGGRALLHHSNYAKNPTGKFTDNPGWRNYMPSGFVEHLANRAGLTVLEHQTFGWGRGWSRLIRTDALTVLEK